jgi:hypothetical protein
MPVAVESFPFAAHSAEEHGGPCQKAGRSVCCTWSVVMGELVLFQGSAHAFRRKQAIDGDDSKAEQERVVPPYMVSMSDLLPAQCTQDIALY